MEFPVDLFGSKWITTTSCGDKVIYHHYPETFTSTLSSGYQASEIQESLHDVYPRVMINKEDVPKMKISEDRVPSTLGHKYSVTCDDMHDLSQDRILKSISIMKSKLMLECAPVHVDRIECKLTPAVKKNLISAYRKLSMYGKKTPFVASFDEYGRRLEDCVKIDTMYGMHIQIVDPKIYGPTFIAFEGFIPDNIYEDYHFI